MYLSILNIQILNDNVDCRSVQYCNVLNAVFFERRVNITQSTIYLSIYTEREILSVALVFLQIIEINGISSRLREVSGICSWLEKYQGFPLDQRNIKGFLQMRDLGSPGLKFLVVYTRKRIEIEFYKYFMYLIFVQCTYM